MKIVYELIVHPLSENDKKLRLFDKLGTKLYKLEFVDLSYLIFGEILNPELNLIIKSEKEFEELLSKNEIFILNFNDHSKYYVLNRLLNKYNKTYIVIHNAIAAGIKINNALLPRMLRIVKRLFLNKNQIQHIYYKLRCKNVKVLTFFAGNTSSSSMLANVPSFEHDNNRLIHKNRLFENEKYHVFLDQNLGTHPDMDFFSLKGFSDTSKYYESLNLFFTELEKFTGKEVRIALHPRHINYEKDYGKRKVYINQTADLVADAEFIMAHNSTAVHYAILNNKKLFLLIDEQIINSYTYTGVQGFSRELSIPLLDINGISKVDKELIDNYINTSMYKSYIDRFIKADTIGDEYSWEIINKKIDEIIKHD